MIRPRVFNTISIDGDTLVKRSSDTASLNDEFGWYSSVPEDIRPFFPDIYGATYGNGEASISMRYVRGTTLHESFVSGEFGMDRWDEILSKIRGFTDAMANHTMRGNFTNSLYDMYYLKTRTRLERLRNNPRFSRFFETRPVINGTEYPDIYTLLSEMKGRLECLYDCKDFTVIHGDLHFGNIILDDTDSIKAVDPRGRFGNYTIFGDPRYDMAKLYHSIEGGYDYITEDMYHLEYEGDRIDYSIEPSEYGFDLLSRLRRTFDITPQEEKEIRLIESLLFLSMIPLHSESPDHQTVMFARGMELYARAIR